MPWDSWAATNITGLSQGFFDSSIDMMLMFITMTLNSRTRNVHRCTSSDYDCCLQDVQHGRARPTQQAGHGRNSRKGLQLLHQRRCFGASEQHTAASEESSGHFNEFKQA